MLQSLKSACYFTLFAVLLLGPFISFQIHGFDIHIVLKNTLWLGVIVFVSTFLFAQFSKTPLGQILLKRLKPQSKKRIRIGKMPYHPLMLFSLGLLACALPFVISTYWLTVAILTLIYILLGLGLNIVVGFAGLLDLGYVAFYAVGAYGYALGSEYLHLGFWSALPFSALLAALFGALLGFPVLKMHGDYLAIVTLGFGEIIRLILTNWGSFTGGPSGVEVPSPTFFGLEFTRVAHQQGIPFHEFFKIPYHASYYYFFIYFVFFIVVCLMLRFVTRLQQMPLGRAFEALREDEIACRSLGINHVTTKLAAFSLGAMVAGIGGVFFAAFEGFINPTSFTFIESAFILTLVVLGGMGSIVGVVLAAIVLTLLPELLRQFAEYRMLLFGMVMVLMMIWRPQGFMPITRQSIGPLR
ncbi:MAG: high-affinity branched-chain amino acid ABC transporter permease LivM [Candidatus Berkiellales bacterium]